MSNRPSGCYDSRVTVDTLEQLRKVREPAARALAAKDYIQSGEQKLGQARDIRDAAVQEYLKSHTVAETAQACGLSESTVKALKRWMR